MQDNQSCMLMHKNHPFSVGKGGKHINARCFFIVNKMDSREVCIVYCPTEQMVADFSSKPLQGKLFVAHRDTMLGVCPEDYKICKEWYKEALE